MDSKMSIFEREKTSLCYIQVPNLALRKKRSAEKPEFYWIVINDNTYSKLYESLRFEKPFYLVKNCGKRMYLEALCNHGRMRSSSSQMVIAHFCVKIVY